MPTAPGGVEVDVEWVDSVTSGSEPPHPLAVPKDRTPHAGRIVKGEGILSSADPSLEPLPSPPSPPDTPAAATTRQMYVRRAPLSAGTQTRRRLVCAVADVLLGVRERPKHRVR